MNRQNARMTRVKEQDNMKIREFLAAKQQASANSSRPYKNNSNVFTHLIDDPTTRQKRAPQHNSCRLKTSPHLAIIDLDSAAPLPEEAFHASDG